MTEGIAHDIVVSEDGDVGIVGVRGDLDADASQDARNVLQAAQARFGKVVLDLRDVEFIDSSGLGIIVGAATRAERGGQVFELRNPSRSVLRTLEIFGLHTLVKG